MGSVKRFPFNKKAKIGRTTILNRIKIGRGIVLRISLKSFFIFHYTEIRKDLQRFAKFLFFYVLMYRLILFLRILELKLIKRPKGKSPSFK